MKSPTSHVCANRHQPAQSLTQSQPSSSHTILVSTFALLAELARKTPSLENVVFPMKTIVKKKLTSSRSVQVISR